MEEMHSHLDEEERRNGLRSSVRRRLNRSPAVPHPEEYYYSKRHFADDEELRDERSEKYYRGGNTHYIVKDDDDDEYRRRNRGGYGGDFEEEEDLAHGLQIYHDYLPQLRRTPDLENAKPIIRMR